MTPKQKEAFERLKYYDKTEAAILVDSALAADIRKIVAMLQEPLVPMCAYCQTKFKTVEECADHVTACDKSPLVKALNEMASIMPKLEEKAALSDLGNSIAIEIAAYGECHCENYINAKHKCPYCESVELADRYKAIDAAMKGPQ